jgi:hypothetical protein
MVYTMEFEYTSSDAAERLTDLADHAHLILVAAGIPAFDSNSPNPSGGAEIEVDTGDDQAGGVYISWSFSRELAEEISGYLLDQEYSQPRIQYSSKIRLAMRDAIITILNAAGLTAGPAEDDIRVFAVRVSQ